MTVTRGSCFVYSAASYGLEIQVNLYKGLGIMIGYKREDTFASFDCPIYFKNGDMPLRNNYYLLGFDYRFRHKNSLQPYIGIELGGLNIVMKDKLYRDIWYFALGSRIGLNWYFSKYFGIRFQVQLLYQVHPKDAPFIYSVSYLKVYPINSFTNLLQFDTSLGFMFRLGK